jgi:putative Mg2+ transporter-C (MgtC) family protein
LNQWWGEDWNIVLARLALAVGLGAIIGMERQFRQKSAGLRTHMMVALGSALFMDISIRVPEVVNAPLADPTRIGAQIISGIGFLGAGAILHSRGLVIGLTTAASIWLSAAIGMACGSGLYFLATIATGIGFMVLVGERIFEQIEHSKHIVAATLRVTLGPQGDLGQIRRRIMAGRKKIHGTRMTAREDRTILEFDLTLREEEQVEFLTLVRNEVGVIEVKLDG